MAADLFIHVQMLRSAESFGFVVHGTHHFFRGHALPRRDGVADGIFAGWSWDGSRLVVQTDRYGASPLFLWASDTQIAVSPSLLAVLECGAPTDLDGPALSVFLRLGYFLGDDTPFTAIRTVAPGTEVVWESGALTFKSAGRPTVATTATSRQQAIDGFIDLCRQSVRRRLPLSRDVVMPLSSGRDSRHILFELRAAGVRPLCVTVARYAPRPSEDERIAPLVASAAGAAHTLVRQNPSQCAAEIRKNWLTHLCADEHAWYMAIADEVSGRAAVMYDGLGGALSVPNRYHSFGALDLIARGELETLAARWLDSHGVRSEGALRRVIRREALTAFSREAAVGRLARELESHGAVPDPIKSFNFWNRIRRELALMPFSLLREVPTVFAPYLDHDVYDFLMGLPPTVMSPTLNDGKAFHTAAIDRAFPQFATLPYEDKKAPPTCARTHNARFASEAGRFLLVHAGVHTRVLDRAAVLPRALLAAVRPAFGVTRPWFPLLTLYLMQLDLAACGQLPATRTATAIPPAASAA
jgi:asparagine synthase (glutamine-hydrolysing)